MNTRSTAVVFVAGFLFSCATISGSLDSGAQEMVTEGVRHRHIVRGEGPWNIHVVSVDLKKLELNIESARAFDSLKGRETTGSIAKRKTNDSQLVVAAINADFFNMETGENDQNQVVDGEIVKGVKTRARHQFGVGVSRKPYIERFVFSGTAITPQGMFALEAVNSLKDSAVVVLNHFYGKFSRKEVESVGVLRSIRRDGDTLVTLFRDTLGVGESVLIDSATYLLRGKGSQRQQVSRCARGDTVRLVLGFLPAREQLRTLVGGLPRIVVEGRNVAIADSLPGLTGKFTETRHPRSGVGFSRDSSVVYLVTVDGRQSSSAGMSLSEFADLMIEVGCYQGLNLDGGGSTAMVVNGEVVNTPSDAKGERAVANVLLVVKRLR
ncbi:MAG: phosphodiester glycosidase family protein [Ignavibacteriae bacterium]|nr:phosphodiester glycosidase family protein [Ignavibacteriota bacterium]